MNIQPGTPAPEFSLYDAQGHLHTLKKYYGKWVLLYIYPADDTPGCTKEACAFRDLWSEFQKQGIVVFGLSADNQVSHQKFSAKFRLPFPLLSDESKLTLKAYESYGKKTMFGKEYLGILRNSFLINPTGDIAKIYEGVNPEQHAAEVLADVHKLS